MPLPTQTVGRCRIKPDSRALSQALEYHNINNIEPVQSTMSAFSKPSETKAATSKQIYAVQKMKMLLVEDSKLLRDILFDAISQLGNVDVSGTATTQEQAISQLNEGAFDIVLLDIELAQGNGFEVIRHIQQKYLQQQYAELKQPVLMMLTNHAHPHYRSLAKTLGVPYFFDKSMDFDLAIDAIELEAERFSNAQH